MTDSPHLIVVDDHRDIRESLARYLGQQGYRVQSAANGGELRQQMRTAAVDLVILDIMMPGEDGLSLCRWLRESHDVPVILLTAVSEDTDRIIGLEMGADDYVTKPFNPRELLARIKAVLRRARSLPPQHNNATHSQIRFGDWVLDSSRQSLTGADGVTLPLSSGEFQLLTAFINHPGITLSRDQLLDLTRGRDADIYDRSVDNQVSRLRRKIEPDPGRPSLIKTVWGGGYQFTGQPEPVS